MTDSTMGEDDGAEPRPDWRAEVQERVQAFRARRGITAALREAALNQPAAPAKSTEPVKRFNPIVEAALVRWQRSSRCEIDESLLPANGTSHNQPRDGSLEEEVAMLPGSELTPTSMIGTEPNGFSRLSQNSQLPTGSREQSQGVTCSEPPLAQQFLETTTLVNRSARSESGQWLDEDLAVMTEVEPELALWLDDDLDQELVTNPTLSTTMADWATPSATTQAEPAQSLSKSSTEFSLRAASASQRVSSGIVDVMVILMVNIPFMALVEITNGNFADHRVQIVLGSISLMLYLFYMTLMLTAAGKTVGMMVTRVVAVDAQTLNLPTVGQAMRRASAWPIAIAWGILGLIFPASESELQSLSDRISGTTLKQAFAEIAEMQAPWFYHSPRE